MARVESDGSGDERAAAPPAPPGAPGPQALPSSSSDTSDDSDDDSSITSEDEDESFLEHSATMAENKILANPYVYSDHVELITVLHQLQNVSRLHSAYERLSGICPMSPSQWLHWLQIEVKKATNPDDRKQLHKLFHRAFIDCYSIHIYTEWCAMSLSNGDGEVDARTVLNRALRLAGSDPIDGAMLWDTAREFELALLYVMETSSQDYSAQVMRIFDIFNKQLSKPLLQAEKTVEEFRTFAEIMDAYIPDSEELVKKVEDAHTLSESILKQLLEFENELEYTKSDETKIILEKCDTYINYINHVKSLLDDNTLTNCDIVNLLGVLYDRVTSECFAPFCRGESALPEQAEKICAEYVDYAREYGNDEYCLNVIEKVVRRCHRKSSLWILKLQQLERMKKDFAEIKNEFEKSLFSGFDTAQDYVTLWLCYLEILRRQTNFSSSEQIEILRKTFRLSWDNLSEMWGDEADQEFTILQFWARIEYKHTKDFKYGQDLFEEILGYGDNKLHGGLWLEYVHLERLRDGEEAARAIFRRAVRSSPDLRIQRAWLALERDHGTLDTFTECVRVSAEKSKEWKETQLKNAGSSHNYKNKFQQIKVLPNTKEGNFSKNKSIKKKKTGVPETKSKNPLKRSLNVNETNNKKHSPDKEAINPKKRILNSDKSLNENTDKAQVRLTESNGSNCDNVPLKRKSDDSQKGDREVPTKKAKVDAKNSHISGVKPPPGYIPDKETPNDVNEEDEEKNSRTAFISNLDFNADEGTLRSKLSEYGAIDELRLVAGVKAFGSICYCVYEDKKSVDVALSHDRALLGDRPMFISRYCPTKDARKKHFNYSTGIERNKLFVKNLPFDYCTDAKLRKVFEEYGKLKDIRIVTHKTGKPKGLAYIDYEDEKSASAALKAVDGMNFGGRFLNVAFSAPPPRKTSIPEPILTTSRGYARTKLFVPTVLQKVSTTQSNDESPSSSSSQPTSNKLSNSDFRSMLLGNK